MPERTLLSVAVITLNEEFNLDRCLRSVMWADEIVVVDSGSTDKTREIAARYGAAFHETEWLGFTATKNLALEKTAHDWVLCLDADEWMGEGAEEEIRRTLRSPEADAYAFNRRSAFCGRFLRSVWYPDWIVRLLRKDRAGWEGGRVHESIRMRKGSRTARLKSVLNHMPYRTVAEYVDRMNRYTSLAAQGLAEKGRKTTLFRMLLSPPSTFLKLYVAKRGFLDGVRGLIVSAGGAYYVLVKYAKLWELTRRKDS